MPYKISKHDSQHKNTSSSIEGLRLLERSFAQLDMIFFHIDDTHTERYHALVETEISGDAVAGISIFRISKPLNYLLRFSMLERHPNGSQAFIPMQAQAFLVVVAPALDDHSPDLTQLCAFITDGSQGQLWCRNMASSSPDTRSTQ